MICSQRKELLTFHKKTRNCTGQQAAVCSASSACEYTTEALRFIHLSSDKYLALPKPSGVLPNFLFLPQPPSWDSFLRAPPVMQPTWILLGKITFAAIYKCKPLSFPELLRTKECRGYLRKSLSTTATGEGVSAQCFYHSCEQHPICICQRTSGYWVLWLPLL